MNRNPVIPHYFGSKNVNGVYQFIINHIPEHTNYVEGFLGSGKILLTKKPAPGLNIGIDKDAAVIDKFNSADHGLKATFILGSFIDKCNYCFRQFTVVQRQSTPRELADELRDYIEKKYSGFFMPGTKKESMPVISPYPSYSATLLSSD